MAVLLTGAAGFIGYHVSEELLARGEEVVGLDNVNDYYDVKLKEARLARLRRHRNFTFHKVDISDDDGFGAAASACKSVDRVVHLAAQAGVRYSLTHPFAYVKANLVGHMMMLEYCRHLPKCEHMVYASSSSVYGGNTKLPFAVEDRTDSPVSLYAATKKADEHMSYCYSHLYGLKQTGLRFFTVYGPWGRPDMALYIFTKSIMEGRPIPVFNHGDMKRDFTYIDDIVAGVVASLDHPPPNGKAGAPHRVYNIGNHRSEPLMRLIEVLERALNRKATLDFQPMQPGDVKETYADITAIQRDVGYAPTTPIDVGVPKFVQWYREYHGV
jgi:UDP-glucuronate 4-epimerase